MSEETVPVEPSSCEEEKTYMCQKRMFRSFMTAIAALAITQNATATMFGYVIGAVFWDWWLYSYKGYKESDNMSEAGFAFKKMTPDQVTKYSNVTVKIRRFSFLSSVLISAYLCYGQIIDIFLTISFALYFIISLPMTFLAILFRVIKYPYILITINNSPFRTNNYPSSAGNGFSDWSDHQNKYSNPISPLSTTGYNNPASSSYTGGSSFLS